MNTCISERFIAEMTNAGAVLNFDDLELLEEYLKLKLETGTNNMYAIRAALLAFLRHANTADLRAVTKRHVAAYLKSLQEMGRAYATVRSHKKFLGAFFRYYKESIEFSDPSYQIPIPQKLFELLRPQLSGSDLLDDANETCYTREQLLLILKEAKKVSRAGMGRVQRSLFHMALVMAFTGMRVSECCTIRREGLHLREGWLETGGVKNANKNRKALFFVLPPQVCLQLRAYALEFFPHESEWVFGGAGHVDVTSVDLLFAKMSASLGFVVKPHSLRKTLISYLVHESHAPVHVVETLTCHAITSLILRDYDKYKIQFRKNDYFQYLPGTYRSLLGEVEKL